jgi:hypothetical protein
MHWDDQRGLLSGSTINYIDQFDFPVIGVSIALVRVANEMATHNGGADQHPGGGSIILNSAGQLAYP